MHTSTLRADLMLLFAAVIWGSGFVAQRLGMEHIGPYAFTGIRFAIGTLVLLPVIAWRNKGKNQRRNRDELNAARTLRTGALLGSVLFGGAALQQIGLVYTMPGKAGFITGLYVVFTPLLGLLLRQRSPRTIWAAVALAAAGLYLLSMTSSLMLQIGDAYVLGGAVVWALQVVLVGHYAPRFDPIRLAAAQFATTALLGVAAALLFERDTTWTGVVNAGGAFLYSGVLSVGVAFTLQVVAQRHSPPAHAAILMSLEAVFAAIFGVLLMNEVFTPRQLLGCALMLAAMLLAQIRPRRPKKQVLPDGSIGPV
jgi:drug/metabolite transporter (DMT)-like permease